MNYLKKIWNIIWKNKFNILILSIYTMISMKYLNTHEPWRDEAQAWLIGRDLSIFGMIKQMYYEAHPCLWSLILSPFAKLGFPYFTMNLISYLIMWFTALLILKKAPFNMFTKLVIIFSSPFMYTYSAIARNYCLIPLAITLIAINYKNRHEKPLPYVLSILMLAWTHIIMLGMVGILYLQFFWNEVITRRKTNTKSQKKKILFCLILAIVGLLLFVIPIGLGGAKNNLVHLDRKVDVFYWTSNIAYYVFGHGDLGYNITLLVLLTLFILYETIFYRKNMPILYLSILFQIYVYHYIYAISQQRTDSLIFIFMFIFWIQREKNKGSWFKRIYGGIMGIVALCLVIMYSNGIYEMMKSDYNSLFSSSHETADFINYYLEDNSIILAQNMPNTAAILPYIDDSKNLYFYGLDIDDEFSYVSWNYEYKTFYGNKIKNLVSTKFIKDKNIYLLCSGGGCNSYWEIINNGYLSFVYQSEYSPKETYIIFKVNMNRVNKFCV